MDNDILHHCMAQRILFKAYCNQLRGSFLCSAKVVVASSFKLACKSFYCLYVVDGLLCLPVCDLVHFCLIRLEESANLLDSGAVCRSPKICRQMPYAVCIQIVVHFMRKIKLDLDSTESANFDWCLIASSHQRNAVPFQFRLLLYICGLCNSSNLGRSPLVISASLRRLLREDSCRSATASPCESSALLSSVRSKSAIQQRLPHLLHAK